MTDSQLEAAETYQRLFVPAEFAEWAVRVVAAARIQAGQRVLDVACGTGVLAREVASVVGVEGRVTGIDLDAAMLRVARRLSPGIAWHRGSAMTLPYATRSFDSVVSQFGLTYFTDARGAIEEMFRVLVDGGRLAIAAWGSLEHTPAYAALTSLLERRGHLDIARALRKPFALGEASDLAALFTNLSASDVAITAHQGSGRFASVRAMVDAAVGGWLPLLGLTLADDEQARLVAGAERALARHTHIDGSLEFEAPAHIVTVTKPR